MKKDKDEHQIIREFHARQSRQIVAMTVAMFIVLLCAVLHKRPDLVGAFSKTALFAVLAAAIILFIGFTVYNWRCPSCGKSLGNDVLRNACRKCGVRLK